MTGSSQSQRVLDVLRDGRPHTAAEIHERAGTMRLNSRVAELRKRGYAITCLRLAGTGPGAYQYELSTIGGPNAEPREPVDTIGAEPSAERNCVTATEAAPSASVVGPDLLASSLSPDGSASRAADASWPAAPLFSAPGGALSPAGVSSSPDSPGAVTPGRAGAEIPLHPGQLSVFDTLHVERGGRGSRVVL